MNSKLHDNQPLSTNLEKYNNIMSRYRDGEFGNEHLTLAEILAAANEPVLLSQMDASELDYLISTSSGMLRSLFLNLKKQKIAKENPTDSSKPAMHRARRND